MYGGYYQPYWTNPDELEHYGVLGMKWGVRKDPDRAYSKASDKLRKLDSRLVRSRDKQHHQEAKMKRKSQKAVYALSNATTKRKQNRALALQRKAAKAQVRVDKATKRADRRLNKALKWHSKMEKVFKDVQVSKMSPENIELGERYVQMKFERRRQ